MILKKEDHFPTKNYRPASILPVLSNIFEKVFLTRILGRHFLNEHKQLFKDQIGFRKRKSAVDSVVRPTFLLRDQNVEIQPQMFSTCLRHWTVLTRRFCSTYSTTIPLETRRRLRSVISHVTQFVQISDRRSKPIKLSYVVPWGSILSLILFLI